MLSAIVTIAAPCTTWIRRSVLKSRSSTPKARPQATMPSSSMTYISATTRGRASLGRQVGGEREAGGLRRLQAGADQQEGERRAGIADPGRPDAVARQQDRARTA